MTPLISILLPTFDGGRYLAEQVRSILAQTLTDIELVVVDDGSTDTTRDQLAEFARADDRVRLLPSMGNLGQKRRLAELAGAARGDLLAIADQDDVWHPAKLERLLAGLGEKAMAFGPSRIIDEEGRDSGMTILDLLPPPPSADDRLIYLFKPMVSAHAMLLRRDCLSDLSLRRAHPFDWLQSLDAVFTRGIAYVPDAVTSHRIHSANQSNGPLGDRAGLLARLAPWRQRQRQNLRGTERWLLTQRLEHLSYSPLLDPVLNGVFRRAHALCAGAWFEIGRPMRLSDPALADALMTLLVPLAGSERDGAAARRWTTRLSRSAWQPVDAARHFAAAMLGPRADRR